MDYLHDEHTENMEDDLDDDWSEDDVDIEHVSYVCEDCDYRWEETTEPDFDTDSMVCPMCGSLNVTQL